MVKKFVIIGLIFHSHLYCQMLVNADGHREQAKATVYENWDADDFTPSLWYTIFHGSYKRGEDRRYVIQNLKNLVTSKIQKELVEKELGFVESTHEVFLAKDIDALPENKIKYNLLIKDEYDEVLMKLIKMGFFQTMSKCNEAFGTNISFTFLNEIQVFKERHNMILGSYRPNAEKIEELIILLADMNKFYLVVAEIQSKLNMALKNYKYISKI